MADASRDENRVPVLLAVTDDGNSTPTELLVDPTTKRLKVSAVITSGGGVTSLNGLSGATQTFATGTTGTDFAISSSGTSHTFNIPTASAANRGLLSSTDWTTFNNKGSGTVTAVSVATANGVSGSSSGGATPALTLTLGAITPTTVNALTLASQAVGFTIAGGTTSKTLTVPLDASVSGTNTGDNAANSSTMYIGTTQVSLNRASAALVLTGITSIDGASASCSGNSATVTGFTPASGSLTLAGADALTLTTSADSNVTFPTTGTLATLAGTETLSGKRVNPRVVTAADDATAVIDVDVTDQYQLTAMANATTISTTGTPVAGQKLLIRLKDDGTGRALTWDAVFRAIGVTKPTTTVASKTHYIGCVYNATDSKFDVLAVGAEA